MGIMLSQRYLLTLLEASRYPSKLYQKLLKTNAMKVCSQNIRKIRRSKDFTQEYMAFEMGISQKAYSDIENSKVKINVEMLMKISDILGVKPSDVCSIAYKCAGGDYEDKYHDLLSYMKQNNIPVPDEYLK